MTENEELYNNVKVFPTAMPLVRGKQDTGKATNDYVVVWANDYGGTRVFSMTLGHNNKTVGDERYLELVTRGALWACDKLNDTYLKPNRTRVARPSKGK
jgi:type 1 glutamine amidotransferase